MASPRSYAVHLKRKRAALFWIDKVTGLLFNSGGLALPIRKITASYTLTERDYTVLADATAGVVTVSLPSVGEGRFLHIKKTDPTGNAVTIAGDGAETIDGENSISLVSQYESVSLHESSEGWNII